jgi:ABC-2 type transport system permease protein
VGIEFSREMAYKTNFFIKLISLVFADIVGPIITILLYTQTSGIPGWSFEEFILFQGTFILVFGLSHMFFFVIPFEVIHMVREGEFNKILTAPIPPLVNVTFRSFDMEGTAEVIVGFGLIGWAFSKLHPGMGHIAIYAFIILLALLFIYGVMILISSLSFKVVKTYGLIDLFFKSSDMARYPASLYGNPLRFFVSFLFPIAVAAYFPASSLLFDTTWMRIVAFAAPIFAFFILSLILWERGLRNYTAAGG